MDKEEQIVRTLVERFPFLNDHINVQRKRRIFTDALSKNDFERVFPFLTKELRFSTFHMAFGVDDGNQLGFVYAISNEDKIILLIKQSVPKANPKIKSVCEIFPNALWHEREMVDLFGAIVEDLPPGPSYPLPDGWPKGNYPLRKEWKVEYFDKETMSYNPPEENIEIINEKEGGVNE